jgi:hypothetical protein
MQSARTSIRALVPIHNGNLRNLAMITIVYLGTLSVPMLADKDITSLIAFVLFAVISVLGNALKKRAEAKRKQTGSSPDEELDEIPELLSAGPTFSRSIPEASPRSVPPIPGGPHPARVVRRPDHATAKPNDIYDLVVAQIARKAAKPSAPKISTASRRPIDLTASEPPGDAPKRPLLTSKRGNGPLDAQTLRSAVIWSEILKAPLGLRDLPSGWQGAEDRA